VPNKYDTEIISDDQMLFAEMPMPLQIAGGILIIGGVLYYSRIESSGKA